MEQASTGSDPGHESEASLFVCFLGGALADGRIGEDHEVVFVVADDAPGAKQAARDKWQGAGRGHVDAVVRVDAVDGYDVRLTRGRDGDLTQLDSYN